MRWKYLSVFGDYVEIILAYMENMANLEYFTVHNIVSKYLESI
jgi:hypothetical protein